MSGAKRIRPSRTPRGARAPTAVHSNSADRPQTHVPQPNVGGEPDRLVAALGAGSTAEGVAVGIWLEGKDLLVDGTLAPVPLAAYQRLLSQLPGPMQ